MTNLTPLGEEGVLPASRWRALRSLGVTTVYYNVEPNFPACAPVEVDEVWDYSHVNLARCRKAREQARAWPTLSRQALPTLRFVPPGALTPSRRAAESPVSCAADKLVFLGNRFPPFVDSGDPDYFRRDGLLNSLNETLGGAVLLVDSVWDADGLEALTRRYCTFVGLHKLGLQKEESPRDDLGRGEFEAVRASQLLSAGAFYFSERSDPADEAVYAKRARELGPLVSFHDDVDAIAAAYLEVAGLPADRRRAVAHQRQASFRTRLAPAAVFDAAGVSGFME